MQLAILFDSFQRVNFFLVWCQKPDELCAKRDAHARQNLGKRSDSFDPDTVEGLDFAIPKTHFKIEEIHAVAIQNLPFLLNLNAFQD